MKDNSGQDPLSWRSKPAARPAPTPQLVSMSKAEAKPIPKSSIRAEPAWKAKDNWRQNAAPPAQQHHHQPAPHSGHQFSSHHQQQQQQQQQQHQQHQHHHHAHFQPPAHDWRDHSAGAGVTSRLSTSLGSSGSMHLAVPSAKPWQTTAANGSHNPWANGVGVIGSGRPNSTLKPSSIATGSLGKVGELGTSPPPQHISRSPPMQSVAWSRTQPTPGPATKLRALQIGGFQGSEARSSNSPVARLLTDRERNENWMLTPTSSLPSLPGTPNKPRDSSVESAASMAQSSAERTQTVDANALSRRREHDSRVYGTGAQQANRAPGNAFAFDHQQPSQQYQHQHQPLPRTPATNSTSTFASNASPGAAASLLGRGIHSSPKRSPLAIANRGGARGSVYAAPAFVYGQGQSAAPPPIGTTARSPGSSPKMLERTLAPIARLPTIETATQQAYEDLTAQPTPAVAGLSSLRSPGALNRRDSVASAASSVQGGYSMSRSRRSSQVISPTSPPGTAKRVGVYRPPHLRNRGSVSGLRPSVAHYDRVRTPNLRGHSRSRESSVSLSRGGSRPPSSLAFYRTDTIPEHAAADPARYIPRERLQSMSSLAGSIREDHGAATFESPRLRHVSAESGAGPRGPAEATMVSDPSLDIRRAVDGASLVAKLEEQSRIDEERIRMIRQNRFDRAAVGSALVFGPLGAQHGPENAVAEDENHDGANSVVAHSTDNDEDDDDDGDDDNASQEFFDLSVEDLMAYGGSDGYALSRHASGIEGRRPGDVFEIGDRLGPGLEHEGQTIRIADTTPGFIDQNGDVTGSQLEVVRKLGEGSYAVVYLVREVMPDDPRLTDADGTFAVDDEGEPALAGDRSTCWDQKGPNPRSRIASPNGDAHASYAAARALIQSDDEADETMVGRASQDLLSTTLKANLADGDASKSTAAYSSPSLEQRRRKDLDQPARTFAPREFALKCLCKRDLPEDMLEVQRLEATIHQSIPAHPNIVTLYRTYETQDWLFLILEYCPGQDLYYWLEQAQDTDVSPAVERNDDGESGAASERRGLRESVSSSSGVMTLDELSASPDDATPPSPSLLASTAGNTLLSRRRVRLVSRMFRQICDAVQFCHERGISHRDIKPENFIVEDRRHIEDPNAPFAPDQSFSTVADSLRNSEARVIVKMTDFGLATAEERCDDFDCGSKPYMAYECHNNVSCDYDPKQADVWSLGVVLLNLLFHRNPFTEPSSDCPSFAAYCYDPIAFLMESFDGLTEKVAAYLAENVFCSVESEPGARNRVSAGELSRWALGLVEHLDLNGPGPGRISRGASMYATTPLIHSRTTSISTLPSMLGSPKARSRSIAREGSVDLHSLNDFNPEMHFRPGHFAGLRDGVGLFTPDILPSPRFTPSPRPAERNPFDAQYGRASPLPPTHSPEQPQQAQQPPTSQEDLASSESDRGSALRQELVLESQGSPTSPRNTHDTEYQDFLDSEEVDAMLQCADAATPRMPSEALHAFASQRRASKTDSVGLPAIPDVGVDAEQRATMIDAPPQNTAAPAVANGVAAVTEETARPNIAPTVTKDETVIGAEKDDERPPPHSIDRSDGEAECEGDDEENDEGDDPSEPSTEATEATAAKAPSVAASNNSKRRKRGARKGRTLAKQLKRSQSVENLSASSGRDVEAQARDATIRELALASETLARQMSRIRPSEGAEAGASPTIPNVSLSAPTAAAAAKYSLNAMPQSQKCYDAAMVPQRSLSPVHADAVALRTLIAQRGDLNADSLGGRHSTDRSSIAETSSSSGASNWSSAAQRRDRINERRATGAGNAVLQDSGRAKPMSWRDRNQSTTTFSSMASNSTVSSRSSVSSESSSVYSTASAPAALTRRDPSLRSRSRASGLMAASGLGTISEREKPTKKQVDASYLAGIFGGDEARAQEKKRKEKEVREKEKARAEAERNKGKLLDLLQDKGGKDKEAAQAGHDKEKKRDSGTGRQASLDVETPAITPSSPSSLFVSRFRRPGSSSSSRSKDSTFKSVDQTSVASNGVAVSSKTSAAGMASAASTTRAADGVIGLRRDASTSTTSLQETIAASSATVSRSASISKRGRLKGEISASEDAPDESGGSSNVAPTPAPSTNVRKQTSTFGLFGKSSTSASPEVEHANKAAAVATPSSSSATPNETPTSEADGASAPTAAATVKKRGMGKFFSGMRDTLMNR